MVQECHLMLFHRSENFIFIKMTLNFISTIYVLRRLLYKDKNFSEESKLLTVIPIAYATFGKKSAKIGTVNT